MLSDIDKQKEEKLPQSLEMALDLTSKSDFVKSVVPPEVLKQYIARRSKADPLFCEL